MKRTTRALIVFGAAALVLFVTTTSTRAQDSFGETTRQSSAVRPSAAPPPQQPEPPTARPQSSVGEPGLGATAAGGAHRLGQLSLAERQDYGVAPSAQLHAGQMHGPTPTSIPGGQLITTQDLVARLQSGQAPLLLLDVLGGAEQIQGAQYAVPAAQSGSFTDATQQQFGQFLAQATGGNPQYPVVLYCLSTQCWMSYNAALRAINLGYTEVLWYRGGIEAWKQAGMPVQSAP